MKKIIILSLLLGIFSSVQSQNIKLVDDHGSNISGSVINVTGPHDQMFYYHCGVKNIGNDTIVVKVRKLDSVLVQGAESQLCWVQCEEPYVTESTNSVKIAPGQTNSTAFSGDYVPNGTVGTSIVKYTFFNVNNPSDYAYIIVQFTSQNTAINDVFSRTTRLSSPLPNPANEFVKFNYSLAKDVSSAKVVIYDLLGNPVAEKICPSNEGQLIINASELNNGVYFYTFVVNDVPSISKKLIIKH